MVKKQEPRLVHANFFPTLGRGFPTPGRGGCLHEAVFMKSFAIGRIFAWSQVRDRNEEGEILALRRLRPNEFPEGNASSKLPIVVKIVGIEDQV